MDEINEKLESTWKLHRLYNIYFRNLRLLNIMIMINLYYYFYVCNFDSLSIFIVWWLSFREFYRAELHSSPGEFVLEVDFFIFINYYTQNKFTVICYNLYLLKTWHDIDISYFSAFISATVFDITSWDFLFLILIGSLTIFSVLRHIIPLIVEFDYNIWKFLFFILMELLPLIRMSVVFPFDISIGNIETLATWGTQDTGQKQTTKIQHNTEN